MGTFDTFVHVADYTFNGIKNSFLADENMLAPTYRLICVSCMYAWYHLRKLGLWKRVWPLAHVNPRQYSCLKSLLGATCVTVIGQQAKGGKTQTEAAEKNDQGLQARTYTHSKNIWQCDNRKQVGAAGLNTEDNKETGRSALTSGQM